MAGALVDLDVILADIERGEIAERLLENFARVEILQDARTAGIVVELPGPVALEQQQPALLQRALDAGEDRRTLQRRGELEEKRRHDVVGVRRIAPIDDVGLFGPQRDAARRRELARL